MGQNRNVNRINRGMEDEQGRLGRQFDDYYNTRNTLANESRGRSDRAFESAFSGYEDFLDRFSSGPGRNRNSGAREGFERYSRGGGVTDENKSRIRGGGVFDEFARTGGLSEGDRSNIRARGTATIPSFYEGLREELGRQKRSQGGYSPGLTGQLEELTRQQAFGAQDAALNAETDIMDRVNEGRRWGSGSMSDAESRLVNAIQGGEMFGISGLSDMDRDDTQSELGNRGLLLDALSGMRGLRTDTPGEVGMYEGLLQNNMMGGAQNRRGILQDRASYNPNKSFLERMGPLIDAGVGVGSMFVPGGQFAGAAKLAGGLGRRSRSRSNPQFHNDWMGGLR